MPSLKDINQIHRDEHNEDNNAKRVYIVGGDLPEIKLPESLNIKNEFDSCSIYGPIVNKMTENQSSLDFHFKDLKNQLKELKPYPADIKIIEVPLIQKEIEIKEIEKPIIIKEQVINVIEKPIFVPEVKIVEIEKVNEKFPNILKVCVMLQTFGILGLLLVKLIKNV